MNETSICIGCGAGLQTDDPKKPGYVPKSVVTDMTVCQRCFRIRHYNEFSKAVLSDKDFTKVLHELDREPALIVHIVDIFDLEGSLLSSLSRFAGKNNILLAINKLDVLPRTVNPNRLIHWVRRQAKEAGLKVCDAIAISAKRKINLDAFIEAVETNREGRTVFVVGASNVGKSTLINALIRGYSDLNAELTTSRYPGTTLDLIRIPMDDGADIIDTPGIEQSFRLTEIVPSRDLNQLLPEQTLKPRIYQLNAGQSLFFGAYVRMDFLQGERRSFTCYVANELPIHRTKTDKADELYKLHAGDMLAPPSREDFHLLPEWMRHSLSVPSGEKSDIAISGLGWITLEGDRGTQVDLYVPKGIKVRVREAMI